MPTHSIAPILGTNQADVLRGGTRSEILDGRGGDDDIHGGNGNDILFGGRGNDELNGGSGDDVLHGSRNSGLGQFETIKIEQDYSGSVIWGGETAGYRNTVGMYKVNEAGEIADVEIIWENASNRYSGGSLIVGQSSYAFEMKAGDEIGFFIVSNGYSYNNWSALQGGSFSFRDSATGEAATLSSNHPTLVHTSDSGAETIIRHHTYHSAAFGENIGLNADGQVGQSDGTVGLVHTVGNVDVEAGTLTLGFEDLFNGGDKDFDDTVFTVDIGTANAEVLNAHAFYGNGSVNPTTVKVRKEADARDDVAGGTEGSHDLSYVGVTNDESSFAARFKLYNEGGFGGLLGEATGQTVTFEVSIDHDALARTAVDADSAWDRKLVVTTDGETTAFSVQTWLNGELASSQSVDGSLTVDASNEARISVSQESLGLSIGDTIHWTARLIQEVDGETAVDTFDSMREYKLAASDDVLHGGTGDDLLKGYDGADTLHGNNNDDVLIGGSGDDVIEGGNGVDDLRGETGDDVLKGGVGNDRVDGGSGDDVMNGGTGDDVMIGANGADVIHGDNGEDNISGGTGNDSLYGGGQDDVIDGGSGDDLIHGGSHEDILNGSTGDDQIFGEGQADSLSGGSGDDLLDGGSHADRLDGGHGNDTLNGGDQNDVLIGGKGDDIIDGGNHNDDIEGGFGDDVITAGSGNDDVDGGKGDDTIDLGSGNDVAYASYGQDVVYARDGHDEVHLGSGDDVAHGGAGKDRIHGDRGNDVLHGEADKDYLYGGRDNDLLDGGDGDDRLYGEHGHDVLYGDDGADWLDGGKNDDTLDGGDDNDLLRGSWGDDRVEGGAGNDILDGGDGEDVLIGGAGDDTYYGGKVGRADHDIDTFQMEIGGGSDLIVGFEDGLDLIDVTAFETSFADLSDAVSTNAGDVVIDLSAIGGSAGDRLTLRDFDRDDLDQDDFVGLADALVA